MAITAKADKRINANLTKYQNILKVAKDRDLNESDTVVIISDMMSDIFGYDKYLEVTSELAVKGTWCDLAIKIEGKFQFIIECKSIGTTLKDNHLRQVVDYGAKLGVPWVALTNGIDWEIYRIKFEQPISYDLVCSFNMLEVSAKKEDDLEKIFVLCKGGLSKDHRENFYEKTQCVNRFVVGGLILSEPVLSAIKRELRKFADGVKVDNDEIEKIIKAEVLKREILEGDDAVKTLAKIKRFYSKQNKQKEAANSAAKQTAPSEEPAPATETPSENQPS
ncbi:putative type IV restriction endonuclease [Elusimicrobium simillimum]|uniref:type I restriction enzyme HsdR N-terminal domain-containing protein n=1 Tax=Elusimicrobium simillimum TaxID=3143438 RepID=UPI003C6EB80C